MKFDNLLFILGCASTTFALTLSEVAKNMSLGVNLGQTFEINKDWKSVENYTQLWPETSNVTVKEVVEGYKALGFRSIRIPVKWAKTINSKTVIEPNLLKSVEEVVRTTLENNMFAVVNLETNNAFVTGFISEDETVRSETYDGYRGVWKQIAEHFKEYDEHLIFEGINDSGYFEEIWNTRTSDGDRYEAQDYLRQVNQEFVDTVRSSDGYNKERSLIVGGYANDPILTQDGFYKIPNDPSHKVMISLYYYIPSHFTIIDHYYTWGSKTDVEQLQTNIKNLRYRFVDQGVPVVITRYGTFLKNKSMANIRSYFTSIANCTVSQNIPSFLSDAGEFIMRTRTPIAFDDEELGKSYKEISDRYAPPEPEPTKPDEKETNQEETTTCFSQPDYPCCSKCDIKVDYDEGEGKRWGIENSNWCGIPESCYKTTTTTTSTKTESSPTTSCWSLSLGYPCCKPDTKVSLSDDSGSWGIENNQWCGISN